MAEPVPAQPSPELGPVAVYAVCPLCGEEISIADVRALVLAMHTRDVCAETESVIAR